MQQKLQQEGSIMKKKITATTTRSLRTTPSRQTVDGAADFHHGGVVGIEKQCDHDTVVERNPAPVYIYIYTDTYTVSQFL